MGSAILSYVVLMLTTQAMASIPILPEEKFVEALDALFKGKRLRLAAAVKCKTLGELIQMIKLLEQAIAQNLLRPLDLFALQMLVADENPILLFYFAYLGGKQGRAMFATVKYHTTR